jgi:hypothetical protein
LCSVHFSKTQYAVWPADRAKYGYNNARARLNTDAVPDVPLVIKSNGSPSASKTAVTSYTKFTPSRGAYIKRDNKRSKAEVRLHILSRKLLDCTHYTCILT